MQWTVDECLLLGWSNVAAVKTLGLGTSIMPSTSLVYQPCMSPRENCSECEDNDSTNSPAVGSWSLNITNASKNESLPINFLSSGDVDLNQTSLANLSSILPSAMTQPDVLQFWKIINWIFVSLYWTGLYDLGQVSPISYDTGTPTSIPPTNNIFVNPDLFNNYTSFLNNYILPNLGQEPLQNYQPISNKNQLEAQPTVFYRSYLCQQKQWKEPLNAAVAIIAGLYSLLASGWHTLRFLLMQFIYTRWARKST